MNNLLKNTLEAVNKCAEPPRRDHFDLRRLPGGTVGETALVNAPPL